MKSILMIIMMAIPMVSNASIPAPFDYARGMTEEGVVLNDDAPGSYFYGDDGQAGSSTNTWGSSKYKVQHEQEEQKNSVDARREEGVLHMAPTTPK
jgi:hypothetical protein